MFNEINIFIDNIMENKILQKITSNIFIMSFIIVVIIYIIYHYNDNNYKSFIIMFFSFVILLHLYKKNNINIINGGKETLWQDKKNLSVYTPDEEKECKTFCPYNCIDNCNNSYSDEDIS